MSSLTRGSMQTYRQRRSLNQSKRVFPVFVPISMSQRSLFICRIARSRTSIAPNTVLLAFCSLTEIIMFFSFNRNYQKLDMNYSEIYLLAWTTGLFNNELK